MRNVQDWNKYVDMLGKAVTKRPAALPLSPGDRKEPTAQNGHMVVPVLPPALPRKGRGARKEETKEELLRRLLDPTLTLEETACILEVCPTTVRRYTNRGVLAHERSAGNQRRFKLSEVLAFRETQGRGKDTANDGEEE